MKLGFVLVALFAFTSCSLMKKKGNWGKDALWPVSGSRISKAFKNNITSAHVWVPVVAAGTIHWAGWDGKISRWAYDENVIFDNHNDSSSWSDTINNILKYEMWITPLLTPSQDEESSLKAWAWRKGKGYVAIGLATRTADLSHDVISKYAKRLRPNRQDHLSFPSGHSTQAGARNMLISKNLDEIDMHRYLRTGLKTINTGLAGTVLLARIEAKRHYPSDVLMGYSIGSFFSGFVYDTLMNYDPEHPESVSVLPAKDQFMVQYSYGF